MTNLTRETRGFVHTQLGLLSVSSEGGGTVQQFQSSDLLPEVRAVLKHHERYVN